MKDHRDQFAEEDIEQIKAYTRLELRLLARMMGDLRKGFDKIGVHLRRARSGIDRKPKILKTHYGHDIAASNISP